MAFLISRVYSKEEHTVPKGHKRGIMNHPQIGQQSMLRIE